MKCNLRFAGEPPPVYEEIESQAVQQRSSQRVQEENKPSATYSIRANDGC